MVYMGSKRKYCKDIVPIIQKYIDEHNITTFVDVFCGGANLIDKIKCDTLIANDLSPSLIALHKQAQINFDDIPKDGSREYWDKAYASWKIIKAAMDKNEPIPDVELSLADIGAIEWYGSFSNGGFHKGYAKPSCGRNYYQEAYRNHQKQAAELNYQKIIFNQGDYRNLINTFSFEPDKTLFYCDSPYKGTTPYQIDKKFDFEEYYTWLREVSQKYPIFISEQEMPEDFPIIWSKDNVIRTTNKENNFKACEKLFFIGGKNND